MSTKTWFITGTSSGFGHGLTETLLARGDRVAATVRKPEALDALKKQYGDRLWIAVLDVTDTANVRRTIDRAFAELGRIDVIVNNAGYAVFGAAEEATDDQVRHQIDTNVIGSIQVVRAALPHLRAQGGGRIIQVSSAGGQTTYPNFSLYHASKWGIEGFIEAVRKEVVPFHIEFTIAEPGAAPTKFGEGLVRPARMPEYENTPAGDVVRAIASGAFPLLGDPRKVVNAIIASADQSPAPRRLAMGSDTYRDVRADLVSRLAELDAQKELALSTDLRTE